jgi:hypothetical protein
LPSTRALTTWVRLAWGSRFILTIMLEKIKIVKGIHVTTC